MNTSLKITIIAASATLMAANITACSNPTAQQNTSVQAALTQTTASFTIEKMTCATCPISVRKAMKRVDGVQSVEVDFKTKIAIVVFAPAKTGPSQIAAASTKVGYPAREIIG